MRHENVHERRDGVAGRYLIVLILVIGAINLSLGLWIDDSMTRETVSYVLLTILVILIIVYVMTMRRRPSK